MKKIKSLVALVLGTSLLFVGGCGSTTTSAPAASDSDKGQYKDGVYYAEEDGYSKNWKYTTTLTVENGKITKANWNGVNLNGGKDKDTLSKDGEYGLKAKGGAQGEWHEEAEKAEAYLVEKQDPTKIEYTDDEGHTDAITGATISVKPFFELAKKALDNGPVAKGSYKDGLYYAQAKEFEKSFKSMAHIAVVNGTIVAVDFNAIAEDPKNPDKDNYSKSGEYGLKAKANAQGEWHEEIAKAEAYLIEKQDPTKITYKDDAGHTDVISGATVSVKEFFTLADEALKKAK